jgi:hypothetical protein
LAKTFRREKSWVVTVARRLNGDGFLITSYQTDIILITSYQTDLITYGSLIFREGDQIVREGEYKSRKESLVTVRFFAEEEKEKSNGHRVRFHSQ